MDHRSGHLPRRRKAGMELRNCITKGAKQLTSIIGRRTQTPHQGPERFAFDVFHDHAKLVAHAAAIDLKVHELGRLNVGVLEHTVYAIAVITLK